MRAISAGAIASNSLGMESGPGALLVAHPAADKSASLVFFVNQQFDE